MGRDSRVSSPPLVLFNSLQFVGFFAVVLALYFTLPWSLRWKMLLLASCVFYMAFIPAYILILATTISIDYGMALLIEKSHGAQRRRYLVVSIVATCLVLFVFKYYDFFLGTLDGIFRLAGLRASLPLAQIILPIGLSFHTFQSLSYVIEVYRGKQKAERNFGIYSLYVMYFPQLVAGPIERPQNLLHQFYEDHRFNADDFLAGMREIAWGYFKKMVIADRVAAYVNSVYGHWRTMDGLPLLLATLFFAVQIYADFSGYSSIAIGCARVMGVRLMTNFNRPYFAESVSDFWRRWHISLSTWFKDYVYIPMGGSRASVGRVYFNLMVTFLVSGIWHGARWTFAVWGAYNGLLLVLEHLANSAFGDPTGIRKAVQRCAGIALILVGWVFFRAEDLNAAVSILAKIATQTHLGIDSLSQAVLLFSGDNTSLALMLTAVFFIAAMFAIELAQERGWRISAVGPALGPRRLCMAGALIGLEVTLLFGVLRPSAFIYFQF
jgi:D-alanyl-lipoteichoic acid acyltransferase DltB (MBOAT superfamily)